MVPMGATSGLRGRRPWRLVSRAVGEARAPRRLRRSRAALVCVIAAVALVVSTVPPAGAYPPNPKDCAQTGVGRRGFRKKSKFRAGNRFLIRGVEGCFPPSAPLDVFLDGVLLKADEPAKSDGSYRIVAKIPKDTPSGFPNVSVTDGTTTYVQNIKVKNTSTSASAIRNERRASLQTIGLAVPLALLLAFAAWLFVLVPRRRRRPERPERVRRRRGSTNDVPRIDGSGFVPARVGVGADDDPSVEETAD